MKIFGIVIMTDRQLQAERDHTGAMIDEARAAAKQLAGNVEEITRMMLDERKKSNLQIINLLDRNDKLGRENSRLRGVKR